MKTSGDQKNIKCMYVSICNTHIHLKKLYTKEYISTMDNLEEE